MNLEKKLNHPPRKTQLGALILCIKYSFDLYRDIKRYGFNDSSIKDITFIVYLVVWSIIVFIYKKKEENIPKVTTISYIFIVAVTFLFIFIIL